MSIDEELRPLCVESRENVRHRSRLYVSQTGIAPSSSAHFAEEEEARGGTTSSSGSGDSTWLANVVMVKKSNGKWHMCLDYTDLNKACLKDTYPMSNNDRLVDKTLGYELLSFLDAYSGYNQIRMYPSDEDKTAFMTDRSNYCYRVMSFGLKNGGATYQRLMDKIFQGLLGRTMEVYIDDMVVKSAKAKGHAADLEAVFDQVRRHDLRLNPEKYFFGVGRGKFHGFMITQKGIEANPDKCEAIMHMRSPACLKEIQQLNGKFVALSYFLPRLVEKAKSFFRLLKGARVFT